MVDENKFLYKDLSYRLVGCFYDVYNELGPAHKEQIYHEALKIVFKEKDIGYQSKPRITISFRGKNVGTYEPDFHQSEVFLALQVPSSPP